MKNSQNNIDWDLAARVYSGEATKAEATKFAQWTESSEHKAEWEEITQKLEQVDLALVKEKVDTNKAWLQVKDKTINKNKSVYRTLKAGYVAAAASIVIAVTLFLNPFNSTNTGNKLLTAFSSDNIEVIDLNDGSKVDLNRNSSIEYPSSFKTDTRLVTLKGEAFFDVAADKDKPFIIDAGDLHIKVVGTTFNVKAYPKSHLKAVTVKSGIVEVTTLVGKRQHVILKAGDKAVFDTNNNSLVKRQILNNNDMAWKTKEIAFENENLSEALLLIEEVYNVSIKVPETFDVSNTKINATFHKNDIDFIIDVIEKTYAIDLIVSESIIN